MAHRRKVGVLGATGAVGQRFLEALAGHPWFEVVSLMASPRSVGRSYGEAAPWVLSTPVDDRFSRMVVDDTTPNPELDLVFSAVGADIAAELEVPWAKAGVAVFSNARTHRMDPDVPLVIPEVNGEHLGLIDAQRRLRGFEGRGCIVTNANCSSTFLAMALAPLHRAFGVRSVSVATLQALSGAGLGLPALKVHGNVVPFIGGEEAKLESEPLKMLGAMADGAVIPAAFPISAQVHRVPVVDGHTEAVSVTFDRRPEHEELLEALRDFSGAPQELGLPSAPTRPLLLVDGEDRPQPSLDLGLEDGMATLIGRIRPCPVAHWKFVLLGHNTIRGAAAGSVLNAELAVERGWV